MKPVHILVTRPDPVATEWAQWLRAQGYQPHLASVLRLVPLDTPAEIQAIKQVVLDFDRYHKAIFVSRHAVYAAMNWLTDYWPQLPLGVSYFAVGETTAKTLAQYDIEVTALGDANSPMNSEHLLTDESLQQVEDERVVIFRGTTGRDLMRDILTERGAEVDYCALYRRELPPEAPAALTAFMQQVRADQQPSVVTVHSGESLMNLATAARRAGLLSELQSLPLVVPALRVAMIASDLGFSHVHSARNAADAAMLETIERCLAEA